MSPGPITRWIHRTNGGRRTSAAGSASRFLVQAFSASTSRTAWPTAEQPFRWGGHDSSRRCRVLRTRLQRSSYAVLQLVAVAAAEGQARAARQKHHVLALEPGLELTNALE